MPSPSGPVDPTDLVVLAVGVVVALLGPAEFVAGQHHRRALGEQQRRQHVAHLAFAQRVDPGSSVGPSAPQFQERLSLAAVLVVFAVGFVVLLVVANEIVQGEAVMRGHEVDAGPGPASLVIEDIAGGAQPRRQSPR